MRLSSLELQNIRSYKHEKIEFPAGLVLLAGDIGSGKSTILLAVEFALFGIRRGELSGSALLRHGAADGSVTLRCSFGTQQVTIHRTLKRTSNSIGQDTGYLIVDGVKQQLTAVELKAKILELLAYPEQLVTKSKGLIFRYTVYTPQEQMKQILVEKAEDRLDTFRKLFGIDTYRQVRENAVRVGRELRNAFERLEGKAEGIEVLEKEKKERELERAKLKLETEKLQKALAAEQPELQAAEQAVAALEKERFVQEELKKAIAVNTARVEEFRNRLTRLQQELDDLAEKLAIEMPAREAFDAEDQEVQKALMQKGEAIKKLTKEIELQSEKTGKFNAIIDRENEVKAKIFSLTTCPTCKQSVDEQHKHQIGQAAERMVEQAQQQLQKVEEIVERLQQERASLIKEEQQLNKKSADLSIMRARLSDHEERGRKQANRLTVKEHLLKEIARLEKETKEKQRLLEQMKDDATKLNEAKERLAKRREAIQTIQVQSARMQEQLASIDKEHDRMQQQILEKQEARREARRLSKTHSWLTKHFTNVMFTIEKHVLLSLYHLFNDAFKDWFSTLIEDETISVRLDDDFSPLVEQNGYEALVDHLSGGEKTSVALAYRLALNKVVNEALHTLKTRDLLILDEPTDGFSSEQLDRVKAVLSRLGLSQVLVVSHEQKMESFVDHVIRVVKHEHESHVM